MAKANQIVIIVEGGMVQSINAPSNLNVEFILRDLDIDGSAGELAEDNELFAETKPLESGTTMYKEVIYPHDDIANLEIAPFAHPVSSDELDEWIES